MQLPKQRKFHIRFQTWCGTTELQSYNDHGFEKNNINECGEIFIPKGDAENGEKGSTYRNNNNVTC